MPKFEYGVENLGTPTGDRASLEQIAKEINLRERQAYIAKIITPIFKSLFLYLLNTSNPTILFSPVNSYK